MRFFKKRIKKAKSDKRRDRNTLIGLLIPGILSFSNTVFALTCIWKYFCCFSGSPFVKMMIFIGVNIIAIIISALLIDTRTD